jgi:xylulokinase
MQPSYLLGIDIGTQGSKGVIVGRNGVIEASCFVEHGLSTPRPGWAEHDADAIWWADFVNLSRRLIFQAQIDPDQIAAIGTCALSPDMLPLDAAGRPLRPAILYGIDTRAHVETRAMNERLELTGQMALTSQDVGPKIVWFQNREPERWRRMHKIVSAHGYVVGKLTGRYTIDHTTAGGFRPFFDPLTGTWDAGTCAMYDVPRACLPEVMQATEIVGTVTAAAAADTGLAQGTPVICGATDFPAEVVSTGADAEGDLVVSYGTTMTLVAFSHEPVVCPGMFNGQGLFGALDQLYDGMYCVGGGMATSAALTRWFRDNFGSGERRIEQDVGINAYQMLGLEAEASPPGSDGLIVLPYFSGERSPIHDDQAQGMLFGLTLSHTRGHVYRALLEGIGYGLAHHVSLMQQAGLRLNRIVATGGGSRNRLWAQIVSDVTGLPQTILGRSSAALGVAFLAGIGIGYFHELQEVRAWSPPDVELLPRADLYQRYREYYRIYRQLYDNTKEEMHTLAQLRAGGPPVVDRARDGLTVGSV